MSSSRRWFDALVFDWDGTAVPDRDSPARAVRRRVKGLCAAGVDVAVVSGTHVVNIDGQLAARPAGPGQLFLGLNRGSELFVVDAQGPRLLFRRRATISESAALDRCNEFEDRGLRSDQMLIVGDEFGYVGGVRGSDSLLLIPQVLQATAVSMVVEPCGVPEGVEHRCGGPTAFVALPDELLHARRGSLASGLG